VNTQGFARKLTAILSADVAGYSRLMGEDETWTIQTLQAYREVMATLIQQHRGRVVDSPGDNLLAEFVSVVDTVQCAVAVQKELKARNAHLPQNRKMELRIGINLGDVVEEGGRIYGDGVNIAARLESLADPGGICVSRTAFDHIESKLPFGYEYLGDQRVKNIAKPVGAYRVLMEPRITVAGKTEGKSTRQLKAILAALSALLVVAGAVAMWRLYVREAPLKGGVAREYTNVKLPGKPSIAVLPFVNMSRDPEQEYFTDGMTEDLITDLSKITDLFVAARNSVFPYKGKAVSPQQVSRELGVKYLVEGSVRKAGDKVRISAKVVDATTGGHVWAERYDRDLKDIFAVQDEIARRIVTALRTRVLGEKIDELVRTGGF
jgi:adenylate cyclase